MKGAVFDVAMLAPSYEAGQQLPKPLYAIDNMMHVMQCRLQDVAQFHIQLIEV